MGWRCDWGGIRFGLEVGWKWTGLGCCCVVPGHAMWRNENNRYNMNIYIYIYTPNPTLLPRPRRRFRRLLLRRRGRHRPRRRRRHRHPGRRLRHFRCIRIRSPTRGKRSSASDVFVSGGRKASCKVVRCITTLIVRRSSRTAASI